MVLRDNWAIVRPPLATILGKLRIEKTVGEPGKCQRIAAMML
jgi:hypothetical protein